MQLLSPESITKLWVDGGMHILKINANSISGGDNLAKELFSDISSNLVGELVLDVTGNDLLGTTTSSIWAAGTEYLDPENAGLSKPQRIAKAVEAGALNLVEDIIKDKIMEPAVKRYIINERFGGKYRPSVYKFSYEENLITAEIEIQDEYKTYVVYEERTDISTNQANDITVEETTVEETTVEETTVEETTVEETAVEDEQLMLPPGEEYDMLPPGNDGPTKDDGPGIER